MPKKKWTEEERKAFADKMKAARAKKVADKTNKDDEPIIEASAPANLERNDLEKQIEELKSNMAFMQKMMGNSSEPQVTSRGVVGSITKFTVDPKAYPDPRERLAKEPKLARFAFGENFELTWNVTVAGSPNGYETKEGVRVKEPKFQIELWAKDIGDAGDIKGKYLVCRGIFFEDPQAAIFVAGENGLSVTDENEQEFLDEMRYIRIRDWLMEAFYPPKAQEKVEKKEVAIGGKLVEYITVNSESAESIPWQNLKSKL